MDNLVAIASQFKPQGKIVGVEVFGNGNINDTFLVTLNSESDKHFILQRINTHVFCQPKLVMQNIRTFTEHVRKCLQRTPLSLGRCWKVPGVLLTQDNQDHWIDADKSFWRAIDFINASKSFDTIQNINHAKEVGHALGIFHSLISDLPPKSLADTLEGYHITPRYLHRYDQVLSETSISKSSEVDYCLQFIRDRRALAHVLEDAKAQGKLPLRPIHGDPKINNFMIDTTSEQAVSIIDLDTVKPGLVQYDIGDCLRSSCNLLGEETRQWETVYFDSNLCQIILQSYLSQAEFLTENDYNYLYDAIRLIAFELGLRFFTDYLAGNNICFRARYEKHNLNRALVQFKLTESIEAQETTIRNIIQNMR